LLLLLLLCLLLLHQAFKVLLCSIAGALLEALLLCAGLCLPLFIWFVVYAAAEHPTQRQQEQQYNGW
jgi:Ca2+/H+ antiporter